MLVERRTDDQHLHTLHEDVLQAFERIGQHILDRADDLGVSWSKDLHGGRATRQMLREQARSVRNLELTMPIVAPMKAGKSTLINAIVGYQLLPARANPMTTLPTKIVLVADLDLDRPELVVPESLIAIYADMTEQLRHALDRGWSVPAEHAYLDVLATHIVTGTLGPLESRYVGTSEVHDVLARLNDQLRLATLAELDTDYLAQISEFPTLRTGHLHDYLAGGTHGGQLVLIDTPGPNENAMAARLGPALEAQLDRSHVVLVVLDYTQMGSDAAAEIRDRLHRHLEIIGSSKIYAVVNKVDARKSKDDLNKEDTRAAVQHSLGLTEEHAAGHVFEVVAHWGLIGSRVLAEVRLAGDAFDVGSSAGARALLKEMSPLNDEEDLAAEIADTTPEELTTYARKFLNRSHINDLINTAIAGLRAAAAPTVINSGLSRFEAALGDLRDVLALERSAVERGHEIVAAQLASLDGEMHLLHQHRQARPNVVELQRRFEAELRSFVDALRERGHMIIHVVDAPEPAPSSLTLIPDPVKAIFRGARNLVRAALRDKSDSQDVHEFPTQAAAQAFMDQVAGSVLEQLRALLDFSRSELDQRVKKLAAIIVGEQEEKVRGLIERAAATLSRAFDVRLKVPPAAVVDGELAIDLTDPKEHTSYEPRTTNEIKTKRIWYTVWIKKKQVTVPKTVTVAVHTYRVSRSELVRQLLDGFDEQLGQIHTGLEDYVATRLSAQLTVYYDGLDGYLRRYQDALRRSHALSTQDEADKVQRRTDLATLEEDLVKEVAKIQEYRERLPQI